MIVADLKNISKPPLTAQTGIFEKHILCEKCEALFSKSERYMSQFFESQSESSLQYERRIGQDGLITIKASGIDVLKFKHFVLSIVWRSHISQHKFFKKVDITENESEIRNFLLTNTLPEEEYKIALIGFQTDGNDLVRFIIDPSVEKIGKGKAAIFFINGFLYLIDLKPRSSFKIFDKVFLRANGEIEVPILTGEMAIKFLKSLGINEYMAQSYIRNIEI